VKKRTQSKKSPPYYEVNYQTLSSILRLDARRYGARRKGWTRRAVQRYVRSELGVPIQYDQVLQRLRAYGIRSKPHSQILIPPARRTVPEPAANWRAQLAQASLPQALLRAPARTPLLPGHGQFFVLQTLASAGGEATTRELDRLLRSQMKGSTLKETLHSLIPLGCIRPRRESQQTKFGLRVTHWQLLPHGRWVLELMQPWARVLYAREQPMPLNATVARLLCVLEALPEGLYVRQLALAMQGMMKVEPLHTLCNALARTHGLLQAHTPPRGLYQRQQFYTLSELGRGWVRVLRALLVSRHTAGKLSAQARRAALRVPPARVITQRTLPVPPTAVPGPRSPPPPPPSRLLPIESELPVLQALRDEPQGFTGSGLQRALSIRFHSVVDLLLSRLKAKGLVHRPAKQWQLTALGRRVFAILEPNAALLYNKGRLPLYPHIQILFTLQPARQAQTAQQILQAAGCTLDSGPLYIHLQLLTQQRYVHRAAHRPHYRLTERGKRAVHPLRQLLKLVNVSLAP
jgi:DNA-binding HxlR family transcriptional regulator